MVWGRGRENPGTKMNTDTNIRTAPNTRRPSARRLAESYAAQLWYLADGDHRADGLERDLLDTVADADGYRLPDGGIGTARIAIMEWRRWASLRTRRDPITYAIEIL